MTEETTAKLRPGSEERKGRNRMQREASVSDER